MAALGVDGDDGEDLDDGGADISGAERGNSDGGKERSGGGSGDGAEHWDGGGGADDRCDAGDRVVMSDGAEHWDGGADDRCDAGDREVMS